MHERKTAAATCNNEQRSGNDEFSSHGVSVPSQASQQEVADVDSPVVVDTPVVVEIPVVVDIPVDAQGRALPTLESEGAAGDGSVKAGLRPPAPNSVEPNGIPTRPPAATAPIMLGEEADAAGAPKELPAAVAQVPDAVPAVPPPSKTIVETAVGDVVPALDIPVPADVPIIEAPAPEVKHG